VFLQIVDYFVFYNVVFFLMFRLGFYIVVLCCSFY